MGRRKPKPKPDEQPEIVHGINRRMREKLRDGKAIDVSGCARIGQYYVLKKFVDDVDYCDAKRQAWIWSIGRRHRDGIILASCQSDLYQNRDFECLWLR